MEGGENTGDEVRTGKEKTKGERRGSGRGVGEKGRTKVGKTRFPLLLG